MTLPTSAASSSVRSIIRAKVSRSGQAGFSNSQVGMLIAAAGLLSALLQPVIAAYADKPGSLPLGLLVLLSGGLSLLSAVLLLICGRAATALRRSGAWKRKDRVYIRTGRGEMCLKTLKDSGNLLREPRSGLPVIVVRAEDAAEAAPLSVLFALGMSDTDDETVIYPVPYRSLGGSGVLYGFRPEGCIMGGTDVKCVVALCRGSDMFGGDCSALCNPDVLEV